MHSGNERPSREFATHLLCDNTSELHSAPNDNMLTSAAACPNPTDKGSRVGCLCRQTAACGRLQGLTAIQEHRDQASRRTRPEALRTWATQNRLSRQITCTQTFGNALAVRRPSWLTERTVSEESQRPWAALKLEMAAISIPEQLAEDFACRQAAQMHEGRRCKSPTPLPENLTSKRLL